RRRHDLWDPADIVRGADGLHPAGARPEPGRARRARHQGDRAQGRRIAPPVRGTHRPSPARSARRPSRRRRPFWEPLADRRDYGLARATGPADPMKATLFHKADAGESDWPGARVMAAVHRAGLQAQYHEVDDEKLAQQAQDAEPLVLVAGGDGTVERVACALQGRAATLVILPTGGSNNIARAYGALLPPDQVLAGLREATRKRLPLGHVYGANGRQCFLESVGVGVLAHSGIDLPKAPTRD